MGKHPKSSKQLFSLRLHLNWFLPGSLPPSLAWDLGIDLQGSPWHRPDGEGEGLRRPHQSFGGWCACTAPSCTREPSSHTAASGVLLDVVNGGKDHTLRFSWIPREDRFGPETQRVEIKISLLGFPGSPVVKDPPCNTRDTGSIPGREDPTCGGATSLGHHNPLEPAL